MNKRFRKGMVIFVTLTFLMQSVIFTSPAMLSVYAETDPSAVESVIDTENGMQDAESPAKAPSRAAGDLTILAFTSDIHNQEDGIAKERLDSWMDYVEGVYGQPIDSMNFCGDMGAASANESQFWTYTRAVMDVVDGQGVHGFYTTGNHEYYNGKFKSTTNAVKGEFVIGAEDPYTTGANYHMYALGTTVDWNGSGSRSDQYEQEQIDALTAYLDQQEGPEPIIILAHFPLHRYNTRTTAKAEDVIDVLNAAAQAGKKIVFLWGHNHTLSDTNYDQIFKPGDTIEYANGSSKQIDFYYASAGCMSDSEYGSGGWGGGGTSGSAYVKGKGLVITIDDQNRLSFAYYNATGTDVTEGGPFTEGDAVTAESIALSPKEMSVAVGDSASITVSYTPATTTQRTVNWTSSDTSVATVDSAGKVTGVRVGTATITATYAGDDTISDTCEVTVKRAPGSGVTPENGKKYVILAGDEYALTSEGDEVGYSNGSGDQIFHYYGLTGEEFTIGETVTPDHLLWTFETSEDGTGFYIKANTGEYLNGTYAENDEGGSTGTLKLDETKDVWIITGMTAEGAPAGAHILKSTNASATASSDKYLTHGNGDNGGDHTNIFTLRSEDNATAVIFYEYNDDGTAVEDPDDPPVDPPTPTDGTVYKLVDQFTSGSDYLIVSRNDAGSGYALTNPGGTSSGASMASTAVTVQSGDIDGDGTADMYISAEAADVVWKATANGERFDITNGSDYLEGKSGKVSVFDSQQYADRGWTYTASQLKHAGGSNTYVVYCEDSAFTATYDSTSNEVYIFEKTETVQGEDPVESVELNKESLTLTEGDSAMLTATVKPATAADKSVTWTSSDEAIATVDEHGKVMAVAEGTAAITVTTTDGGKTATCEVTVEAAPPAAKYVLTDTLEAGKEYLIVNDATVGGSGSQALKNPGGTSGGASPGKTAVTVLDGNIIETADTDIVWTATENEGGFYLTNNGDYLEVYQGNLRIYNPVKQGARYWTYADTHLTHRGGSNPYYAAYSNGSFAYSSSAAEIYLFVKEEETVHEHTWGEWTVTTPATCSAKGAETRICEACGETETRETAIDENAHAWGEWVTLVEPTCTEKGVQYHVCSFNAMHMELSDIDPAGHTLVKTEANAATCMTEGNMEYWTCSKCGELFSDEEGLAGITLAETVTPKAAHTWSDWTVTTPATCEAPGEEVRVCSVCGEEETREIAINKDAHAWGEWQILTNATCTEKGVMFRDCLHNALHKEVIEIPAAGHKLVETPAREATCTAAGTTEYWTCGVCGMIFSDADGANEITIEETVIPMIEHDWSDWTVTTPATCEEAGVETRTCSVCGEQEMRDIAVAGHNWGEWTVTKPATEEEEGEETRICANDPAHKETRAIPKLSHTHVTAKVDAAAPTCEEEGNIEYWVCSGCGKFFAEPEASTELVDSVVMIPKTGHDWGEWQILIEQTCTEKGVRMRSCSYNPLHMEVEELPPPGHATTHYGAYDATCEHDGNVEYWACSLCGKTFSDEACTAEVSEVILKAYGHDWSDWVVTKAATCSAAGSEERVCANDPSHKESREIAIDGSAHTWGEWEILVPATCTAKGVKIHRCVYNNTHAETEEIPAAGHQWGEWAVVTEPTCTTAGSKTRTCETCGRVETEEIPIDAEAHDWGGWTVLKAAECGEEGFEFRTCGHNGLHKEFRLIPARSHQMTRVEARAATDTTPGNIEYYTCDLCGAMFFDAEGTQPAIRDDVLLKRGWLQESDGWHYYLGTDGTDKGTKLCNGWTQASKGWCWMDANGDWTKGKWIKDKGSWYYIRPDGYMASNQWVKASGGWCYVGAGGKMVTNGWVKDSKGWCWMGADGYWVKNKWIKDKGTWYYINASGYMASSQWVKTGGRWYYLKASGAMATGTQTINGKTYRFDSSGRWVQ